MELERHTSLHRHFQTYTRERLYTLRRNLSRYTLDKSDIIRRLATEKLLPTEGAGVVRESRDQFLLSLVTERATRPMK